MGIHCHSLSHAVALASDKRGRHRMRHSSHNGSNGGSQFVFCPLSLYLSDCLVYRLSVCVYIFFDCTRSVSFDACMRAPSKSCYSEMMLKQGRTFTSQLWLLVPPEKFETKQRKIFCLLLSSNRQSFEFLLQLRGRDHSLD